MSVIWIYADVLVWIFPKQIVLIYVSIHLVEYNLNDYIHLSYLK